MPVTESTGVTGVFPSANAVQYVVSNVRDEKMYKTRFFYNTQVVPAKVDAFLAARRLKFQVLNPNTVRLRVFSKTVQQTHDAGLDAGCLVSKVTHNDFSHPNVYSNRGVGDGTIGYNIDVKNSPQNPTTHKAPGFKSDGPGFESLTPGSESSEFEIKCSGSGYVSQDVVIAEPSGHGFESSQVTGLVVPTNLVGQESGEQNSGSADRSDLTSSESVGRRFESGVNKDMTTNSCSSVNAATEEVNQLCPIYDVNNVGMEEKFVNTIIFANHGNRDLAQGVDTPIFRQWQRQVDFQFGFVPLGCQLMPISVTSRNSHDYSPIEIHKIIRKTGKPNFYKLAYLWRHNCMLINGKVF